MRRAVTCKKRPNTDVMALALQKDKHRVLTLYICFN